MIKFVAVAILVNALPSTLAFFPLGPAFVFQTSSRPPNNTSGSFTSNISFDAITNVSNVVVAVSQTMGRSLENELDDGASRRVNSSVFLFKDGNWTSFKLRKRRSTFDLAKQITNQVFAAVNAFMNTTANQTTFDLMEQLLNASALNNRSSRAAVVPDPFRGVDIFDEESRDLLYDLESTDRYSESQLATVDGISKSLATARFRVWRASFRAFADILSAANTTMTVFHEMFNKAVDNFAQAIEKNEKCWPTEPSLAPLATLFRASADAVGECYGKVVHDGRATLDAIRGNLSSPLRIPAEITKQFNYCTSMNTNSDVFAALAESACFAKIPLLLEHFALNSYVGYNNLAAEGQSLLIRVQGDAFQCALQEINAILEQSLTWQTAYGQCLAGDGAAATMALA